MIIIFLIIAIILVCVLIIDFFLLKKFTKDTSDSINSIFDKIKTVIYIAIIDRIFSDNTDSEDTEDSDLEDF
jgi:hypothetical protein